jgi:nicotinamidase-related amidase
MKKRELLIIDAQNDFCEPEGALYVNGAEEDCRRLASYIEKNKSEIEGITITLDSHHLYDIAHPPYWENSRGEHPDPFTLITMEDLEQGNWRTVRVEDREQGVDYVKQLDEKGRYQLCIWPPHCLIGSWGTQLQKDVFQAVMNWEELKGKSSRKILKGINPGTEHYGAFEAEVPLKDDPATELSLKEIEWLDKADEIFIAGEAMDFCVANTVRQIIQFLPSGQKEKIVLLEDCMSAVDPSSHLTGNFLSEMRQLGLAFVKSTEKMIK